jgi:hypothetical protein
LITLLRLKHSIKAAGMTFALLKLKVFFVATKFVRLAQLA